MMLKAVVLPAPFGPIKPTIWLSGTSSETPSRATIPPNRRVTLRSESRAIGRWSLSVRSCRALLCARAPQPEGDQPLRRGDSLRGFPRVDLLPLGELRDVARPDDLRGRVRADDAGDLDRLPPALHPPLLRDVPADPLRARRARLDGGAGSGDPLGLRPPQAPQLRRPRGRPALAARRLRPRDPRQACRPLARARRVALPQRRARRVDEVREGPARRPRHRLHLAHLRALGRRLAPAPV